MAFDDSAMLPEAARRLSIVPFAGGWAIKHGDGFLGVSADREEAARLLHVLEASEVPSGGRGRQSS